MEALGFDAKLLIAQVINFVLFLLIFKKFISKPFFSYLKQQKRNQEEREKLLVEIQNREKMLEEKETKVIKEAREEAAVILSEAKKSALVVREEIIKKAEDEAAQIREKANKQIEIERQKVYTEAKRHLIETGTILAKNALADFIDKETETQRPLW